MWWFILESYEYLWLIWEYNSYRYLTWFWGGWFYQDIELENRVTILPFRLWTIPKHLFEEHSLQTMIQMIILFVRKKKIDIFIHITVIKKEFKHLWTIPFPKLRRVLLSGGGTTAWSRCVSVPNSSNIISTSTRAKVAVLSSLRRVDRSSEDPNQTSSCSSCGGWGPPAVPLCGAVTQEYVSQNEIQWRGEEQEEAGGDTMTMYVTRQDLCCDHYTQ